MSACSLPSKKLPVFLDVGFGYFAAGSLIVNRVCSVKIHLLLQFFYTWMLLYNIYNRFWSHSLGCGTQETHTQHGYGYFTHDTSKHLFRNVCRDVHAKKVCLAQPIILFQGIMVFTGTGNAANFFAYVVIEKELFALTLNWMPVSYQDVSSTPVIPRSGLKDQLQHTQINETVRNEETRRKWHCFRSEA